MTQLTPPFAGAGRPLWTAAGLVSVAIGAVGAVLPVLPTTPFVILGAVCFAKGAPCLAQRMEQHGVFGPMIADWQAHGAIAPRIKAIAHVMMGGALVLSLAAGLSVPVLAVQMTCLLGASAYILSRPSGRPTLSEPGANTAPARSPRPSGASPSGVSAWPVPASRR